MIESPLSFGGRCHSDQLLRRVLEEKVPRYQWVEPADRELGCLHHLATVPRNWPVVRPMPHAPARGWPSGPSTVPCECPARVERHVPLHRFDTLGWVDPGEGSVVVHVQSNRRNELLLDPELVVPFGGPEVVARIRHGDQAGARHAGDAVGSVLFCSGAVVHNAPENIVSKVRVVGLREIADVAQRACPSPCR